VRFNRKPILLETTLKNNTKVSFFRSSASLQILKMMTNIWPHLKNFLSPGQDILIRRGRKDLFRIRGKLSRRPRRIASISLWGAISGVWGRKPQRSAIFTIFQQK